LAVDSRAGLAAGVVLEDEDEDDEDEDEDDDCDAAGAVAVVAGFADLAGVVSAVDLTVALGPADAAGAVEVATYHSLTPWWPRQAPLLVAEVV
jgi:hypothetical protein